MRTAAGRPPGWQAEPFPKALFKRRTRSGAVVTVTQWEDRTWVTHVITIRPGGSEATQALVTACTPEPAFRTAEAFADSAGGGWEHGID